MAAHEICNEFKGLARAYCMRCLKEWEKDKNAPITIKVPDGTASTFTNVNECIDFSDLMAKRHLARLSQSRKGPSLKKASDPSKPPIDELQVPKDLSHPIFKVCNEFGISGSKGRTSCQKLVGVCMSKSKGPFKLPAPYGEVVSDTPASCINDAQMISDLYTKEDEKSDGKKGRDAKATDDTPFSVDGESTFAARFMRAGFFPEISDKIIAIERKIKVVHGEKSVRRNFYLAYKIEPTDGGKFKIRYKIQDKEFPSPDKTSLDDSITFSVSGNRIVEDLAFGISGNPTTGTIRIVKLKSGTKTI